jgi:hypothetical protein
MLVLENWSMEEFTLSQLPTLVCWYIWLGRNRAIFENTTCSIKSVCFRILGDLEIKGIGGLLLLGSSSLLYHLGGNNAWFDGASQNEVFTVVLAD